MSSAFFRRPTDTSSSSGSADSPSAEEDNDSYQPLEEAAEDQGETATTESLASRGSEIVEDGQVSSSAAFANVDHHRTNLLSALLEDFAKTRACEMMNSAGPATSFTRSSAEIQPLARQLYQHVSQSLALGGLLPPSSTRDSPGNQQIRAAYLAGIEGLALSSVQATNVVTDGETQRLPSSDDLVALTRSTHQQQGPFSDTVQQQMANLSLFQAEGQSQFSSPYSNLTFPAPPLRQSHYDSSFQQLRLLGKGGFGRVYHTYNIFDKKEYAVKKIPLSPRLSRRYRESGHEELENVLREVQALAQLEHNNVVRYHATWIEEPRRISEGPYRPETPNLTIQGRRLIAETSSPRKPRPKRLERDHRHDLDDGIIFGTDGASTSSSHVSVQEADDIIERPTWSRRDSEPDTLSARTSDIFTDGISRPGVQPEPTNADIDDSVYVLHVQMSVYPMTLAQYLAPPPSNSTSAPGGFRRRHCFHLVPALRILMGILCGLQYIHAKGLVHRDIKPSNIFLSSWDVPTAGLVPDGYHDVGSCAACPDPRPYFVNPRIGDFGLVADLARHREDGLDGERSDDNDHDISNDGNKKTDTMNDRNHNKPVGTEYYRPPASTHTMIDEKLDVFALGVTLVEMLWCCTTSSERLHILRDLQKGKVPAGLGQLIESEGHAEGIGSLVEQGILGMIDRDRRHRWSCPQVQDWAETVLKKCASGEERQAGHGDTLTKIVTLEAEAHAENSSSEGRPS
ncbi:PEK protein kinase [Capronia coronata CBS 617.96]|uniref:PEK protein kinase n=1 Tax=Capronia coronata CBS 617.96 TaxID=1182541 RepID=W9YNN2_9EURO|nr:PEK protein kinase [Capronia coronata CBS 617.96]EXJ94173.1 PEK protein kinase [Capronia coronata CBS 617.96]